MSGSAKRVTAADVASRAQVSTATVSLVMNGKADGRVSEATRARVLAAVAELGYRVDPLARDLATGRGHHVALVVPDIANPYFSQLTQGVAGRLGDGYRLQLIIAPDADPRAGTDRVVAERVDGILAEAPAVDLIREVDGRIPVVVLDEPSCEPDEPPRGPEPSGGTGPPGKTAPPGKAGPPYVGFALADGATALADHLLGLGHHRIGYLDADRGGPTFPVRRRHLERRLREVLGFGFSGPDVRSRTDIDSAAAAFAAAWRDWRAAGVTALVCAADVHAYGVLRAASGLGVPIPDELSVAAFDDLPFSALVGPPLTTVRLSAFDLGETAAGVLLDLMEGREVDPGDTEPLPAPLRVRGTTAPPKCSGPGTVV
jgi:LacI family transcriptional regulator